MKISVIVPFWNSEEWLGECCESLLRQDGDFEFILVDDKSTDTSRDIAYDYCNKDERFTLITNFKTKGVSGARNTGIEYASGEWVTFLDADDELLDNAYRKFIEVIADDPKALLHQFNHLRYYKTLGKALFKYFNGGGRYDISNLPQMWFGVWNKLYKAELIKDIRFDERLQYGEDGLFILECLTKTYIHHAERDITTVKHKSINSGSLSKSKTADDVLGQIHIYEEFMLRQTDPKVKNAVCKEIALLWSVRMTKAL